MNTTYSVAIIFTKHTNLLPWFEACYHDKLDLCRTSLGFNQLRDQYARPRDVQLILLVRYDDDGRPICKIKCPISPLPIIGEFKVVSMGQITDLLRREGWAIKEKIPMSLLK